MKFYRSLTTTLLLSAIILFLFSCSNEESPFVATTMRRTAFVEADITYQCEDGSILSTYKDKTVDDYMSACTHYENMGYSIYTSTDMAGNLSTTYINGEAMAHIYWHPSTKELNIVLSETAGATLPPATPAVTNGDVPCTIAQMMDSEHNIGMGYIIQLTDGSYIIYDGSFASQSSQVEKYLLENHTGDGKPIIRAWVLTHSHNDHYSVFQTFADQARKKEQFIVEYIIVSPMNEQNYSLSDDDGTLYLSTTFHDDAACFTGAKVVFAHTGMKFTFGNLNMEVLYTPESCFKASDQIGYFNNTSVVTRLYDENYSALFLGDVGNQGTTLMAQYYGSYLESDICQVSHHGLDDVPLSFYELVKSPILFYPCNLSLYEQTEQHRDVRMALERKDYTKEILIAGLDQYVRAWGTTFEADAPLIIPNHPTKGPQT